MLYLILAIICSGSVTLTLRFGENHCENKRAVVMFNYVTAIAVSFLFLETRKIWPGGGASAALKFGLINGVLYITTFCLCQYNIRKNGTPLTATFSHLGVLIPTVLSIFLFGEFPGTLQWLGVLLAVTAIIVLNFEKRQGGKTYIYALVLYFVSGGFADMMSKVFEHYGDRSYDGYFLFYTFCVAFVLSVFWVLKEGKRISLKEAGCGILVGLPNYFSTFFFLKALTKMPSFLVFLVYSVGTVVFVNLVNLIFLKEPLSKRQYLGMIMICLAIVLMNW